ncbi:hypothetical protein BBJ28_00005142 [Nothophytophthora sp. Chile5]|nr:hypothetical protein BBJ28_00005142 [Nothophytophthora sp. Chile5]
MLAFYAPDPTKDDSENTLVKKEVTGKKGSISFTAEQNGDHWVCVSLDSSNYALPDSASMRFVLKLAMGTSSEEYQHLAKKNQMNALHLEILKLRDRVRAIQRNQDYAKVLQRLLETFPILFSAVADALLGVLETPRGHAVYACDASETDWNAFVEDEAQEIKSTHMEWIGGKIYIVELSSPEHESYRCAFLLEFCLRDRVVDRYLISWGQSYVDVQTRPRYEPDQSFGPTREVIGAVLPPGLPHFWAWHTLKVEVGHRRRWRHSDGQLDWKADEWATFPGVRYVLCVAVEDELAGASYKLHRVEHEARRLPHQDPVPIVAPQTVVTFDSRLLLGLQPGDALPGGFPDPLVVDLYAVLQRARCGFL